MSERFDWFIVLAEMRTGSNLLEANLNALDGVTCYGEAFNPHFVGHRNRDELLGITLEMREKDPLRLIEAMRAQGGLPGFRFFHDHDPRVLDHALKDARCAKVVLTRNPVESYVSLKIAARTDQWQLKNVKHQRSATARFDAAEFEAYLDRLQGFQLRLLRALQTAGQTAFYLSYEDLQDVEVLNGLAGFLGCDDRLKSISGKLKKQNPAPMSEKVENYDEMLAALARLDRFDLSRTPNFEPRRGPVVPGYLAAARAPLLFMPVKGGPTARVVDWLAKLDGVQTDELLRDFSQKTLRQWKRRHPGHRSFTVVTHPVERAHGVFRDHILSDGPDSFPAVRDTLKKLYKLALPKEGPGAEFGPEAQKAAFLAFLRFVKASLGGQTGMKVDAAWATQDMILRGMAGFAMPDIVMRAERLEADLALIAAQVGHDPAPPGPSAPQPPIPLSEIYDDEVEAAVRDAYQRDYIMFGYGAWR